MGKVMTQVSMAMLMAACSMGYPAMQESPTVVPPVTVHNSGVVSAEGDGYFVVVLGGMPFILAADFAPG
jgi:hypothetical protein